MREKARKLDLKWDLQQARRVLEREDHHSYLPFKRRQVRSWRVVRKARRGEAVTCNEELQAFANTQALPDVLQQFSSALIAHPAEHADLAFWWDPDVRLDVLLALPKGMASERLSRTSSRERMHFCVDASSVQLVPPLLAKHAQRCQCWSF